MANQLTGKQTMSPLALETKHTFKIAREQEEGKKGNAFCDWSVQQRQAPKSSPITLGSSQHTLFIPVISILGELMQQEPFTGTPFTGVDSTQSTYHLGLEHSKALCKASQKPDTHIELCQCLGKAQGWAACQAPDLPGLSRMTGVILAKIFTCSRITAISRASFQMSCSREGKTPLQQSLMMISKSQFKEHLEFFRW